MSVERSVSIENILHTGEISSANWEKGFRIFRAPTIHDGRGTHKRLPHEITRDEVKEGDILILLCIFGHDDGAVSIPLLQFCHVTNVSAVGEFEMEFNTIVGDAADGESIYDRLAAMLGLSPSHGRKSGGASSAPPCLMV